MRGRDACFGAIDLDRPGTSARLLAGDEAALAPFGEGDVEILYWTGVAWGSAIGAGLDRPESVAGLPTVRAIFERALALDETFDRGSLHEAMIVFDSMPPMMGGSFDRARAHYDAAIRLSDGKRASPHVTWARASAVARQAQMPPGLVEAAFALPAPEEGKPSLGIAKLGPDRHALVAVTAVTQGDLSSLDAETRKQLRDQMAQARGLVEYQDYIKALRRHYVVTVAEDRL